MKKFVEFLGSFGLAAILLVMLMVLTYFGTVEQEFKSTHQVVKEYFSSFYVVHMWNGKFPIPWPGAMVLLPLLFVNLLVGGLWRMRKGTTTIGVFIVHLGIVVMLVGSYIEHQMKTEGFLPLREGETGRTFYSSTEQELAVEELRAGKTRTFLMPQETFEHTEDGGTSRIDHPELPFTLVLSHFAPNNEIRVAKPDDPKDRIVGGRVLLPVARFTKEQKERENKVDRPGLILEIQGDDGKEPRRAIVSLMRPFLMGTDSAQYRIGLRRKQWDLPFDVRLNRFIHEFHPGTRIPRRFSSFVTQYVDGEERDIEITMNEPLRSGEYVLYQSSYDAPQTSKIHQSVFQVVRNPSDRVPLISCIIIMVGLLIHFLQKLRRYLKSQAARAKRAATTAVLVLAAVGLTACGDDYDAEGSGVEPPPLVHAPEWPAEAVDALSSLAIQHKGRIKPLNTYATYALMRMSGKKSVKVPARGETDARDPKLVRIQPMDWLLTVLFAPDVARTQEVFLIEDDAVLTQLGLDKHDARQGRKKKKKKRDYYSFDFLVQASAKLSELTRQYHAIPAKKRDNTQDSIVTLSAALVEFHGLLRTMDWARANRYAIPASLQPRFDGRARIDFHELPTLAPVVRTGLLTDRDTGKLTTEAYAAESQAFQAFVMAAIRDGSRHQPLHRIGLLPPTVAQEKAIEALVESRDQGDMQPDRWLTPANVLEQALLYERVPVAKRHIAMLEDLQGMARAGSDSAAFGRHATSLANTSHEIASRFGVEDKISMEAFLTKWKLLSYPQHFFLLSFVLVAISWFFARPKRWYDVILWISILIPTAMLIWGITLRSLIREQPPMSTLYDTVLFVGAFMVLSGIVFEWLTRKRIALAMMPALGFLFVLVASGYEYLEAKDTMGKLMAVLDTSFWLATHVVCIAIGYAAALLTAALGNVYVLGKVGSWLGVRAFGWAPVNRDFFLTVGRMLYGALAFGMIFATVGTILGGIWANDSWGRFWGWDPKENGALMIVLVQLAMLHARLGGYLKTFGLAMSSLLLGIVVAFSWWGVNLLSVGLHSYGFVSGIETSLHLFYGSQLLVFLIGGAWWMFAGKPTPRPEPT